MPALGVLLVIMVGYGVTTGGFAAAFEYPSAGLGQLDSTVVLAHWGHAGFHPLAGHGRDDGLRLPARRSIC